VAGRGPAPKAPAIRRRRNTPAAGEWQAQSVAGWQFESVPEPPEGLGNAAREAWATWMGAWFAAHWTPADLPGLRRVAQLYDMCEQFHESPYIERDAGKAVRRPNPATELRQLMDNYGITPKGAQDRRWVKPEEADSAPVRSPRRASKSAPASPYADLRLVSSK
jgi:hypothetical protein